ncbi:MAG: hypothetical protein KDE22_11700 [Rhodobacterales bacterium]|nr:hypothetical protein [Rhodobacterales bacterium]
MRRLGILVVASLLSPWPAGAQSPLDPVMAQLDAVDAWLMRQQLAGWTVDFENTLAVELYDTFEDKAALGPYRFDGAHPYDEFSLSMGRVYSPYETFNFQLSGLWNGSSYRSRERALIPERINLRYEKGDGDIPFRMEAGDFFADYSLRTMQRSVKGAQLEFQPDLNGARQFHSINLFAGSGKASWVSGDWDSDTYAGASWLVADNRFGSWVVNGVFNRRDSVPAPFTPERTQGVVSLAGEKDFTLWTEDLTLEGELSYFRGDHNRTGFASLDQDQRDKGEFLQLKGSSTALPLSYRLRYEHYGKDYAPAGAIVSPDHSGLEAHGTWRFDNGLRLRGRWTRFGDQIESNNPTTSETLGATLSGPFLAQSHPDLALSGVVDVYERNTRTTSKSTVIRTRVFNANMNMNLSEGWTGRAGLLVQQDMDRAAALTNRLTRQASLSADRAIALGDWKGVVTPGMLVRRVHGNGTTSHDWNPSVAVNLRHDEHSLGGRAAMLLQEARSLGVSDLREHSLGVNYAYNTGPHTLRLESDYLSRDRAPGESTNSVRIGLYWTFNYNKPAQSELDAGLGGAPVRGVTPVSLSPADAADLRNLVPGDPLADVQAALASAGIRGGSPQAGVMVYETPLLDGIDNRQRLALRHADGRLAEAVLVIDFRDTTVPANTMREFADVRDQLLKIYGPPTNVVEDGAFDANLKANLRNGTFVRLWEWRTRSGLLRFGIPRRLDGDVRMELVHARALPPTTNLNWSLEQVR